MKQSGGLTERQFDVLRGLLQMKTDKQIASDLGISIHTIAAHKKVIFRYLGIADRQGLMPLIAYVVGLGRPLKARAARSA